MNKRQKMLASNFMRELADCVNNVLNIDPKKPNFGFALFVFNFHEHNGKANYVSNTEREDLILLLKQSICRLEGMADIPQENENTVH